MGGPSARLVAVAPTGLSSSPGEATLALPWSFVVKSSGVYPGKTEAQSSLFHSALQSPGLGPPMATSSTHPTATCHRSVRSIHSDAVRLRRLTRTIARVHARQRAHACILVQHRARCRQRSRYEASLREVELDVHTGQGRDLTSLAKGTRAHPRAHLHACVRTSRTHPLGTGSRQSSTTEKSTLLFTLLTFAALVIVIGLAAHVVRVCTRECMRACMSSVHACVESASLPVVRTFACVGAQARERWH